MRKQSSRYILIEKYISPTVIDKEGNKFWYNKHGALHSFNGQPSCVLYYRRIVFVKNEWHKNGKRIA